MPKYNLHNTVFVFNLFAPLVAEFKIKGIIEEEGFIYYSCDGKNWVREDYLHQTGTQAYFALIAQAEKEFGDYILPTSPCREESMVANAEMDALEDKINE